MKKYFNFAFLSAIALVGTLAFTACSSTDDTVAEESKVEDNPTYDAVAQTVTTQFVLNVSSAANDNTTRQSATTVQKNSNFRGMQDAKLIGLSTGHSSYLAPYNGEATTGFAVNKTYDLGTLYGATAVDNTGTNNADNSSRRVLQLTLPLNTDAMLVYARAIPSGTDEENGKVTVVHCTYDPASRGGNSPDGRKVKGTIHWVNAATAGKVTVRLYENLIDESKGVYNEDGSMNINPDSLEVLENCRVEPALMQAKGYDSFQFIRNGFFCADAKLSAEGAPVFGRIVSLKSSFRLPGTH